MRFGLTSPVVTLTPRGHGAWEESAGAPELAAIARAADRLGFHHLTCSEHVAIPEGVVATRGGRYWDPLATLGYLAAVTEKIRLATHVVVLPYHHPLEVVKRYGTLDRLAQGRLILGVGVGSLEEEFALLGVPFADRGPRYEDHLRALHAAWGRREPVYAGSHFRFSGFVIDPCATSEHPPLWLGGRSPRSLRRALEFADGWDPFHLAIDELRLLLARARDWPLWRERDERGEPCALIFSPDQVFDLTTAAGLAGQREQVERYQEIGTDVLSLRFRARSCAHLVEQLEIFAQEIAPAFEVGAA